MSSIAVQEYPGLGKVLPLLALIAGRIAPLKIAVSTGI
jgi:hypothetical protein